MEEGADVVAVGSVDEALFGDDGGDEGVGGDVEGGVVDVDMGGGDGLAGEVGDFVGEALFDGDVLAGGQVEVEGGGGSGDVEGDLVGVCEDGEGVGADFVGGVAVGSDAVGSGDDEVDFLLGHEEAGHAVGDEGGVDAGLGKFPGGEACALEEGSGFVDVGVEGGVVLVGGEHECECGAELGGGEASGVAVGEYAVVGSDEGGAVLADGVAHGGVLVAYGLGFGEEALSQLAGSGEGSVLGHSLEAVEGPGQIDGGGSASGEVVGDVLECGVGVRQGGVVGEVLEAQDGTEGGGDADGGCAADLEDFDGLPHGFDVADGEHFGLVWQEGLVNEFDVSVDVSDPFNGVVGHGVFVLSCENDGQGPPVGG